MAYWPELIRDRPYGSFTAVVAVTTLSIGAWLAAASWGPAVWVVVVVLALACIALLRRHRIERDARVRAAADPFSFGDVVVQMRERDEARAVILGTPTQLHPSAPYHA